jgi:hypothetical protein
MTQRRTRRMITTVAMTALLLLGVGAQSASAWTFSGARGRIGSVTLPAVYVDDLLMPNGYREFTLLSNNGPLVYRSPATNGFQTVRTRYAIEKFVNGAWYRVANSPLMTRTISSGQSAVRMQALYLQPGTARGYFRVTWAFEWYNANGVLLADTLVLSNQSSDHTCVTPYRWCASYAGYVRTGVAGGW